MDISFCAKYILDYCVYMFAVGNIYRYHFAAVLFVNLNNMSLYKVKTKYRKCCNGVTVEPGMEVQVVTPLNNTVQVNDWKYVEEAFLRVYGISLRKANCLNASQLEITKLQ